MSQAEVTNLLLEDRIAVNRSEKEVKNYFKVLKSLEDEEASFSVELVCNIHEQLFEGIEQGSAGKIRDSDVVIGKKSEGGDILVKHTPPAHKRKKIDRLLRELINWVGSSSETPLLKTGVFHHQFVYIHPFLDGNGRVCRLATALLFLREGYKINKYFVLDDYYDVDRSLYSDKLHSADPGEKTEWLEYFTEGVKYSLMSSKARIESGLKKLSVEMRPTDREKEALAYIQTNKEVTSSQLAEDFGISRQQAYNLLKGLVEKGFIDKKGGTKSSYYVI